MPLTGFAGCVYTLWKAAACFLRRMERKCGMRRKDREITDTAQIMEIWKKCRVCRLAMADGPRPYVVPMNFGVEEKDGQFTIYLHCAPEGRRLSILERRPAVCVEADCEYSPIESNTPCRYSCTFASVIGEGKAEILQAHEEKAHGLSVIMEHQAGKSFSFSPAQTGMVAVIRIRLQLVTAKRRA